MTKLFIRVSLHRVTGTFNDFIHIRIIKGESTHFNGIIWVGCFYKVFIPATFLTFFESKWNGHFTIGLQSWFPKMIGHFYRGERNRSNGISLIFRLRIHPEYNKNDNCKKCNSHVFLFLYLKFNYDFFTVRKIIYKIIY